MPDPVTYSSRTPRLGLPLLFAGQAQKENTVNETAIALDLLMHAAIEGAQDAPPSSPTPGQMWLIGPAPTGDWAGYSGQLTGWTEGGWRMIAATPGLRVYDKAIGRQRFYDGDWNDAVAPSAATGGSVIDNEARAAIIQIINALTLLGILSD